MEASEAVNKAEVLKRENERMNLLTADLGNQVHVVLSQVTVIDYKIYIYIVAISQSD